MRIIDLSRVIKGRIPISRFRAHAKVPFTRVETSAFIKRHGRTVDQVSVEDFMKSAVLLDLSGKVGVIDDEELEGAEEAAGVSVRENEILVIRTRYGETPRTGRWLSRNAVDYLLFKRIFGVGVDCSSIDQHGTLRAHDGLLSKEVLVFEDLCNLEKINQSRFRLVVFPLRMKAPSSPARILALTNSASYW